MSAFVNTKKLEKPNDPKHVKHKRRPNRYIDERESAESSSNSSCEISSDDEPMITKEKIRVDTKSVSSSNKITKIDKLSDDPSKKTTVGLSNFSVDEFIPSFSAHILPWGGFFTKNLKKIKVINTCTIDNHLFSLWVLSKLVPSFKENIPKLQNTHSLIELIEKIDSYEWDRARQIWYTKIMKMDINGGKSVNFYGTVEEFVIKYMYEYQVHELIQKCDKSCYLNGTVISEKACVLHFGKLRTKEIAIVTDVLNKCSNCDQRVICNIRFRHNPNFIFIETTSFLKLKELPLKLDIQNNSYKLLNIIFHLHHKKHFVSVFEVSNQKYLIDDLDATATLLEENELHNGINFFELNISSALYFLLN